MQNRSPAVRQIFSTMSWTNLKQKWPLYKEQDEDVLSYALFPQVATDFFKYRQAQEKKVDEKAADTENGAYPVIKNKESLLWTAFRMQEIIRPARFF